MFFFCNLQGIDDIDLCFKGCIEDTIMGKVSLKRMFTITKVLMETLRVMCVLMGMFTIVKDWCILIGIT